ncbi:hypothetical protein [[Limnothrix rosea] IAM M-220]|uniref:hypothetical protein n=1 Tax=[Limnothrix rosea] IAM M-220 TaxID=454133 RepID=UPI000963D014|nr:hypothetical protein [[Limnothrix rosea] IAM M-220]OKH12320.1 hypothetical protein NIES208_16365 [[Limnothrix rosea] IAM M-220]
MPKYNATTTEAIANAIETTGEIQSGIETGNISSATFHRWRKEHSEFDQRINEALETFRANSPQVLQTTAMARLRNALDHGQVIKRTRTTTKTIKRHDPQGQLMYTETHEETRESVDQLPTPKWAIERILGKPIQDLEDAIKLIETQGLEVIVKDAEIIKEWLTARGLNENDSMGNQSEKGLSEEQANEIRAKILGIPLNIKNN